MKKIQEEVVIPNGEDAKIFKNDYLDRESEVKNIAEIVNKLESSTVFTIDSDWGTGKTTFVRFLDAYLQREKGIKTCFINAWENDFETDPFVLITTQIIAELKPDEELVEQFKKKGKALFKTIIPKATTYIPLIFGAPPPSGGIKEVTDNALSFLTDSLFDGSESGNKSAVQEFKDCLKEILEGEKLIIFVDELDRCRPTFAIETLERIKHLFNIDGVIFILSTNVEQLSHSVSGVYGQSFDGKKYLERFIDFSYHLRKPSKAKYWISLTEQSIDKEMPRLKMLRELKEPDEFESQEQFNEMQKLEKECKSMEVYKIKEHGAFLVSNFNLSIRDMNRIFFKLKLILLTNNQELNLPLILLFLFIRYESEENFQLFCTSESTKFVENTHETLEKKLKLDLANLPPEEGGFSVTCSTNHGDVIVDYLQIFYSKKMEMIRQTDAQHGDLKAVQFLHNEKEKRELQIKELTPNPFEYEEIKKYKEKLSLFCDFDTGLGHISWHAGIAV